MYSGNSHIECYKFCQKCKDHFDTARAKEPNRIPFAALFLQWTISHRWIQHTARLESADIIWPEFKQFLQKNLGNSWAFVNGLWSSIKRDSQYQSESALDWASHPEYLQSILWEFDLDGAPGEPTMIRYFWEGLKPSIRAEMEQPGRELDIFEKLVKKAKGAEAKAALWPRIYDLDTSLYCLRGNRPEPEKAEIGPWKDPRVEKCKPRTQKAKPAASQPSTAETYKARKEKKKDCRNGGWKRSREQIGQQDSTLATWVNTLSTSNGGDRNRNSNRPPKDQSQLICWNCDQKSH